MLFLAVCWLWQPLPGVIWEMRGPGLAALRRAGVGVVLTHRRRAHRRRLGTSRRDSNRISPRPIEFKAEGPFAIVRHPIYLGWVLMVFATPVMTTSQLLFAVVSTLYLIAAIPFEERSLLEAFGEKYGAYQKQMRWKSDSASEFW